MATRTRTPGATTAVVDAHHSWIAGRRVEGRDGAHIVTSPSSGEMLARVTRLDERQLAAAVAAAREAAPAWASRPIHQRQDLLGRVRSLLASRADEIAELIAREQGKTRAEARVVEVLPALESLKHLERRAADALQPDPVESEVVFLAHKRSHVEYPPFGVVLVISPWNYPLLIPLSIVAAALVAGNTVVLKPAPAATLMGFKIAELFERAGLPAGALNVVALADALAPRLVEDPRIDKVFFTGGTDTARKVMASASKNLTPVVLELGGKDPAIVCRDADLDRTAAGLVWGAFMNSGQTCVSVERVYVEEAVAGPLQERIVERARALRSGDSLSADVELGAMTLESQLRLVEQHVADAVGKGARVLTGGERGEGQRFPPTVLVDVDHSMRVMREETFGPLLPIMKVPSVDGAVELANDSDYGLTASIWSRDDARAREIASRLDVGVVTINDCVYTYGDPSAPFGGVKKSGMGRTHGRLGLREMVRPRFVAADRERRPPIWWYPYGERFEQQLRTSTEALHGKLTVRFGAQLRLLMHRRFWQRTNPLELLKNFDRLF